MRLDANYNMCSKLGFKLIFDEIMVILVLPDHFPILTAFSQGGYFLDVHVIQSLTMTRAPTKSMRNNSKPTC